MNETKKSGSYLLVFLLLPLAVGAISALLSGNMSASYAAFQKPAFSPPGILFPIVWTILYLLMGISSYIIDKSNHPQKKDALQIYFVQLFFNFMWSILFFGLSDYLAAFWWLLLLIGFLLLMIYKFFKINKTAACLQIPYLLWCIFAAVLNFSIYRMNKSML